MLPVNVDGLIWLNTIFTEYKAPLSFVLLTAIFLSAGLLCCLLGINIIFHVEDWQKDFKKTGWILIIIGTISSCAFYNMTRIDNKNKKDFVGEPDSYLVYFTESMDYKALYENYEIVNTEGNIVTIKLKEN